MAGFQALAKGNRILPKCRFPGIAHDGQNFPVTIGSEASLQLGLLGFGQRGRGFGKIFTLGDLRAEGLREGLGLGILPEANLDEQQAALGDSLPCIWTRVYFPSPRGER